MKILLTGAAGQLGQALRQPRTDWVLNGGAYTAKALADTGGRLPAPAPGGSGMSGMNSTAKQLGHRWAFEQTQQSLESAAVVGGGVELEGKSASIKSSSECIHSSNALSLFGLRPTASTAAPFLSRAVSAASLWRDRAAS